MSDHASASTAVAVTEGINGCIMVPVMFGLGSDDREIVGISMAFFISTLTSMIAIGVVSPKLGPPSSVEKRTDDEIMRDIMLSFFIPPIATGVLVAGISMLMAPRAAPAAPVRRNNPINLVAARPPVQETFNTRTYPEPVWDENAPPTRVRGAQYNTYEPRYIRQPR